MRLGWSPMSGCCLCKTNVETTNHILMHFDKTQLLCTCYLLFLGFKWVIVESIGKLLLGWKAQSKNKRLRTLWCMGSLCLFWCIWKEYNGPSGRFFTRDCRGLSSNPYRSSLECLWEWLIYSLLDFIDGLSKR